MNKASCRDDCPVFLSPACAADDSLVSRFGRMLGERAVILNFWNEASEVETIFDHAQRDELPEGLDGRRHARRWGFLEGDFRT